MTITEKLFKRKHAKNMLKEIYRNGGDINDPKYKQLVLDASFIIKPKGPKANPFGLVFDETGHIDFLTSRQNKMKGK